MVDFFVLTLMSFEKFCHLFVAKLVHEYLRSLKLFSLKSLKFGRLFVAKLVHEYFRS